MYAPNEVVLLGIVERYGMDRSVKFDIIPYGPAFRIPCQDRKVCMAR